MKSLLAAALTVAPIALGAPPANAHCHLIRPWDPQCWTLAFTGNATIACFGCGPSSGTARLWISPGAVQGVTSHNATASFSLNEPSATCPATGSASGSVTGTDGGLNLTFNWTRVGATAVITTSGDINGGGVAVFKSDSTLPCGGTNVTATFAGAVAGT